jgi:hypothetical protein
MVSKKCSSTLLIDFVKISNSTFKMHKAVDYFMLMLSHRNSIFEEEEKLGLVLLKEPFRGACLPFFSAPVLILT